MQFTVNGEKTPLEGTQTVSNLITRLQLEGKIAVEINREILPRSQYSEHIIQDGDIIEIVHAIGGG